MRKVYVDVKIKVIMNMDEGIEVGDVIDEMDYDFTSNTDGVDIEDTEVLDYEVTDSK
jgi:hypothetical protein